jgi:hypothetical protein
MLTKILAIALIALGLVGLTTGSFSFTTKEKVVDIGPVDVTREEEHSQRIPVAVSIVAILAGSALLFVGMRQHRTT